jgi:broad specificity phosphatase PhoE
MDTITTAAFVRHGHVLNPNNLYYGRLPRFKLSEQGVAQAHTAADILSSKPVSAVFSSPMLRCRQTAKIITSSKGGVPIHISRNLHEVYSPLDGCPISVVIEREWDVYTGSGPQFEQRRDIIKRVQQFVSLLRRQYFGKYILVVTHGEIVWLMTLWASGIPLDTETVNDYHRTHPYISPASITTFVYRTR